MKETGIIMSGDHPLKILDGTKTMTRRTWGLEKVNKNPDDWQLVAVFQDSLARFSTRDGSQELTLKCPYGGYGDRLWVKETWWCPEKGLPVAYKANLEPNQADRQIWKPSIFMPRWASRILLEITELRAERLQEITIEDCKVEGIPGYTFARACLSKHPPDPRWQFIDLWDSLNAKRGYGWDKNPFIWVIEFSK